MGSGRWGSRTYTEAWQSHTDRSLAELDRKSVLTTPRPAAVGVQCRGSDVDSKISDQPSLKKDGQGLENVPSCPRPSMLMTIWLNSYHEQGFMRNKRIHSHQTTL